MTRPVRKTSTCSSCSKTGHTKATCPQVDLRRTGSKSEQAALWTLLSGCTLREAAEKYNLTIGTVCNARQRLMRRSA